MNLTSRITILLCVSQYRILPSFATTSRQITNIPPDNGKIITEEKFTAPWNDPTTLLVKTNVPVSLLRWTDPGPDGGMNVLGMEEAILYVKSDCDHDNLSDKIHVRLMKNSDGAVAEVSVTSDIPVPAVPMPDSTFNVSWGTHDMICDEGFGDNFGMPEEMGFLPEEGLAMAMAQPPDEDEDVRSLQQSSSQCNITAEILYDGCQREIQIAAPIVKLNDVTLSISSQMQVGCSHNFLGVFPISHNRTFSQSSAVIPSYDVESEKCRRIAMGRPFRDSEGRQLQATIAPNDDDDDDDDACWSPPISASSDDSEWNNDKDHASTMNDDNRDELARDWKTRSLGEHASIASFAAFTIALMTNNAPPSLIRESLRAALDEVDHATTSFELASLLTGDRVTPGALPPAALNFETDLGTMLDNTFREGCIDETFAALAAAATVDDYASSCRDDDDADADADECRRGMLEGRLKRELTTIAVDESRHAALAWRTIRWGCSVDPTLCANYADDWSRLFAYYADDWGLKNMSSVGRQAKHFSGYNLDELNKKLSFILRTLIPFVTGLSDPDVDECELYSVGYTATNSEGKDSLLVIEIVDNIIRKVLCADVVSVETPNNDVLKE